VAEKRGSNHRDLGYFSSLRTWEKQHRKSGVEKLVHRECGRRRRFIIPSEDAKLGWTVGSRDETNKDSRNA